VAEAQEQLEVPSGPVEPATSRLGWIGVALFAVAVLFGVHRLSDNSFLTHLATGRLILDGKLPHTDPYSFTAAGRPWVVQSWLASVIDAGLERIAGLGAVRLFCGLLMGALVWLIWRLTKPAGDLMARLITLFLAAGAGVNWWGERPQMIAFVLLAAALVVVTERRSSWWLAPIFLVWVNVHASWPVGLAIVGAYLLSGFVDDGHRDAGFLGAVVRPCVVAAAGCVVGALVSPYGVDLLTFPLHMAQRTEELRLLIEWRAPKIFVIDTMGVAIMAVIGLVGTWRSRRPVAGLLVVVLAAMTAYSARNIAVGAVALVPVVARSLNGFGSMGRPVPIGRRATAITVVAVLVLAPVLIGVTGPDLDLTTYPVTLIDRLEAKGWVARPGIHLVARDTVGNYLGFRYGESARVFVDDRAEVYPYRVLRDEVDLTGRTGDWGGILDRYGANIVVWPVSDHIVRYLDHDPGWRSLGRADGFGAWCRVSGLDGC